MLSLKKDSKTISTESTSIAQCPICTSFCQHQYYMEDAKTKKKSKWFSCHCGVIFQDKPPSGVYDTKYRQDQYAGGVKYEKACKYPIEVYGPIIEELCYGRKALVVGTPTDHQVESLMGRGWVTFSIDKNERVCTTNRHIQADFESFEFAEDNKFNMIWMYHTLECFLDPVKAIKKCFTLMPEDGILFIATPDTDFINTRSSSGFNHWKPEYNNIMWNRRALVTHLENQGFSVVMARRNYEHRFPSVDDIHIIAQKVFF